MTSLAEMFKTLFGEMEVQQASQIEVEGRITDNVHLEIMFNEFLLFTCEGNIMAAEIMEKTPIGVYAPPEQTEDDLNRTTNIY